MMIITLACFNSRKKTASTMSTALRRRQVSINEQREIEFASKIIKHTAIGAVASGAARMLWLTPVFNLKTLEQTEDLILPEAVNLQRSKEQNNPEWWLYTWRGTGTEMLQQSLMFLLNRGLWHSKSYGLLNYFGDEDNEHTIFSIMLQNALSTTILYPIHKSRIQQAMSIRQEDIKWLDFQHTSTEAFRTYFLYNLLVGVGTFFLDNYIRTAWFDSGARDSGLATFTNAEIREKNTWSYYLAVTAVKLLLNPLETMFKKKIVEDSVPGLVRTRPIKEPQSILGFFKEYFKGAIYTIPEVLMTGMVEFYTYRVLNRAIAPHDSDE